MAKTVFYLGAHNANYQGNRMKRILLVILLSLTGLVLVAVVALGVFLATFNPNAYKDQLSAAMVKATGRSLQFQSDLEVSLFPRPGLKTGKVLILDPAVFGADPFLSVESAMLSISLDSLLDRTLEIEDTVLSGVSLHLITNTVGQHNWEFARSRKDAETGRADAPGSERDVSLQGPAEAEQAEKKRLALKIQQLHCADASVTYRDMRSGAVYSGTLDSFTLLDLREGAEIPLVLAGDFRVDERGGKIRFSLEALLHVPGGGNPVSVAIDNLEMKGEGFTGGDFLFQARGNVSYTPGGARVLAVSGWQGQLSLSPAAGSEERTIARTDFRNGHLRVTPAHGTAPARFEGGVEFGELDISALLERSRPPVLEEPGESVKGAPNMTRPKVGKPRVSPELARQIEEMTASKEELEAEAARAAASVAKKERRFPEGSFAIAIEKLSVGSLPVRNIRVDVTTTAERVAIPYAFELFQGRISGTGEVGLKDGESVVSLTSEIRDVDMEEATRALSGKFSITGLLNGDVSLSGRGSTVPELMHSLGGKAKFHTGRGTIKGFTLIPPNLPSLRPLPVDFPFDRMAASLNVEQGVATSRDIALQSKVLAGRGGGKIHLAYGQVDLGIDFLPAGIPPAVPVSISGPYNSLSYSVDMRTFIRNVGESAADFPEDAAKGLLRNIGGALLR